MPTISFPKTDKFKQLKVGDKVTRMLCGEIPIKLKVTQVDADTLMCGPWKFSRETGAEIDEDLDWDGFTATGSFLKIESETLTETKEKQK